MSKAKLSRSHLAGFSLIEVLIAIVIITAGLIALSGALVVGVTLPQRSRQQELAKQLANTIMESVISAKEAARPGFTNFDSISYTTNGGRFVPGITAMLTPGPDGIYCTCDDGKSGVFSDTCSGLGTQVVTASLDPGPDGRYDTAGDNRSNALLNFTREIIIRDLTTTPVTLKEIEVRVYFSTPTGARERVTLICQLSNFRTL